MVMIKEEIEFLINTQKHRIKFWAPGKNQNHSPMSSTSDTLTIELLKLCGKQGLIHPIFWCILFFICFLFIFVLFCCFKHSMNMKNKWNSNVFCVPKNSSKVKNKWNSYKEIFPVIKGGWIQLSLMINYEILTNSQH